MSRRAGTGLAIAVCVVVAAWIVGSTAVLVLGLGLVLAALAERVWSAVVVRRLSVERRPLREPPLEGQALTLGLDVHGPRWLASRLVWHERLGALGEHAAAVARDGSASIVVPRVPRGRYRIGPGVLVVTDPLGLGRADVVSTREAHVTVRPRVPVLPTLFTETGSWGDGGRRLPIRRPSGLEPHGVREYAEGEPLRAVHWPSSARRGELMVRELEDAPRDNIAVVLDVDAASVAGPHGASSFDDAVRAAAGLVRAHALRSRRVLLVVGAPAPVLVRVRGLGQDWELALDALSAVEPHRSAPLAELVGMRGALAKVPELVVLTARPHAVADALSARAALGRATALVAVDAPTYAGRAPARTSSTLLRLSAAGVAIALLRHEVPLSVALGAAQVTAVG